MNQVASPDLIAAALDAVPALLELRGVSCDGEPAVAARGWRTAPRAPALEGVDLAIRGGEIVGVLGESGCGTSTLARICAGLVEPSAGVRRWKGRAWDDAPSRDERPCACRVQLVHADARAALDPRWRVLDLVGEGPLAHHMITRKQQVEYVALQLNRVGLDPMLMRLQPREFTAGQCVRIALARALAVKPELVVIDDALARLDMLERAQILDLVLDLRQTLGLACLLLGREPEPVAHVSDRLVVMCRGRIVETGPVDDVMRAPLHPYANALLANVAPVTPGKRVFVPVPGDAPPPTARLRGCPFHTRCPHVLPVCRESMPALASTAEGRQCACHRELASPGAPSA